MNDLEFRANEIVTYLYTKVSKKLKRLELDFDDDDIYDEISNAIEAINLRRHFEPTPLILLEDKYKNLAYELCIASMTKEGAEGQISHSENGISRGYDSSSYPESMLRRIVPLARMRG